VKKIKSYLKSVLSSKSDASSKRFVAVLVVLVIIAVVFINIFTGKAPVEYVMGALVSVVAICFGGVAVENIGSLIRSNKKFDPDFLDKALPPDSTVNTLTDIQPSTSQIAGGIPKVTL
jgi:hypothetical protein